MSGLIQTPYGILSFPTLFSPKPRAEGGKAVYSCVVIFDEAAQRTPEYKAMQAAFLSCAQDKWGPSTQIKNVYSPFKDAGEKSDKYQGYEEGFTYISPWSERKPGIVDARLQDVLTPEEVYAGQKVRLQVSPFAWLNSGRKGVSFGLQNVQIVGKNAPRIDGRVAANKAFNAVEDESMEDEAVPF
jgi:hypothetical protein